MADDIAALIDHLGLEQPDVVGYSLGGGVAFQTAVKYPAKVRRLVSMSAHIRRDAILPEMLAQQEQVNAAAAEFLKDTPMYQLYQQVAPHPEDFPRLLDKMGESMAQDFDFSEEVRGLQVPTLIVAADADMAPPSHYVEIFGCSMVACATAGGWARDGQRVVMRLRSCPASPTTTSASSPLFAAVTPGLLDASPALAFRRRRGWCGPPEDRRAVSMTQQRFSPGSKLASSSSGAKELAKLLSGAWFI